MSDAHAAAEHEPADPAGGIDVEAERRKLPARALTYWRVAAVLGAAPFVVGFVAAAVAIPGLPSWARLLIVVPPVAFLLLELIAAPIRHRLWWYAVGEEQIDLRHGWPVTTRTAVPMVRVQHVEVEQGPLARSFTLAELQIHTAAGPVQIPALDRDEADRIRRRIAELAQIPDDL